MARFEGDPIRSADLLAAYDAILSRAAPGGDLEGEAAALRIEFERRTGAFRSEEAWFETRSRAFWDDALTTPTFADRAGAPLLGRAHRGLFVVDEVDRTGAVLRDLWSGVELETQHLDEAQALAFEHAEGAFDARVLAFGSPPLLFALPGAYHHVPDALEPLGEILDAARERDMSTTDVLDALLRMDLVLRSSSRVKVSFAYRASGLSRPR
jgi:hypothetical protein